MAEPEPGHGKTGTAPPLTEAPGPVEISPSAARIGALDAIRGLALVAVLAYHVAPSSVPGGFLGVESFFVLSGYLLTAVLLDEQRRTGAINVLAYAERRFRRLAPALLVLLVALVVLVPVLAPDDAHRVRGDVVSSLMGVTNWHLIADQASYFQRFGRPSFVRHLWSVAVEIQFYVLCPFLVAWLARRRRGLAIGALAAGIGLSAGAMAVLFDGSDPYRAYYGTDTRIGALLAGSLLAVVMARARPRNGVRSRSIRFGPTVGPLALVALVALFFLAHDRGRLSYPGAFLATQALTAALIVAGLRRGPLTALLDRRGLRWLGLRSYGIYLWHWPAVVLTRFGASAEWPTPVTATVTVAAAVALGAASYRLVELPILRRRPVALPRPRATITLAAAIGAVGAAQFLALLAHLPDEDPLEKTLQAGEVVLATQPPTTVPPTTTTAPPATAAPTTMVTTSPPAVPVPPALAPAPPPPAPNPLPPAPPPSPAPSPPAPQGCPAPVRITAIGDSVMVSAAGALHARLGPSGYIDAKNNRQFADSVAIARTMREERRLSSVMVVHLGNNGPVKGGDIDALMRELAEVPTTLLVNVRVNGPWQDSVNATLADAARRHPAVRLVDWYGASEGHGDWFQSDGTHFKTTSGPGANAYADLISSSISPSDPAAPPPPPCP